MLLLPLLLVLKESLSVTSWLWLDGPVVLLSRNIVTDTSYVQSCHDMQLIILQGFEGSDVKLEANI